MEEQIQKFLPNLTIGKIAIIIIGYALVLSANSLVFKVHVFNYSSDFPFCRDEIKTNNQITVTTK